MTKQTKTKLLEELYFDSGNSGMSLRVVKKTTTYENSAGKARSSIRYQMEYSHGAFGENTVVTIPLGNPKMARYIAEAIMRTANTMEKEGSDAWKHSPFARLKDYSVLAVKDGLRRRRVYRVEMVTGPNSTSSDLLGLEWLDESGRYVYHEVSDSDHGHGSDCISEDDAPDLYAPHEIGKSLREVHAARLAADPTYTTYWNDRSERSDQTCRYVDVGVDPWPVD